MQKCGRWPCLVFVFSRNITHTHKMHAHTHTHSHTHTMHGCTQYTITQINRSMYQHTHNLSLTHTHTNTNTCTHTHTNTTAKGLQKMLYARTSVQKTCTRIHTTHTQTQEKRMIKKDKREKIGERNRKKESER